MNVTALVPKRMPKMASKSPAEPGEERCHVRGAESDTGAADVLAAILLDLLNICPAY
jgi:hypothetical protein